MPGLTTSLASVEKTLSMIYSKTNGISHICCIGAGYVGGPTSAIIAAHQPNINVTVVDRDEARIAAWNSSSLPVSEPGLQALITIARDGKQPQGPLIDNDSETETDGWIGTPFSSPLSHTGDYPDLCLRRPNLFFSTDVDSAIQKADLIFLCVDTPAQKDHKGKKEYVGVAPDLSRLDAVLQKIANNITQDVIIVEKSTVPCGTARRINTILTPALEKKGIRFEVISNPEFLAEGTTIRDLLEPDRVLIGSAATGRGLHAARLLASVYAAWVPRDKIVITDTFSAELSKLAANALLAQRISSINALSVICEEVGADVREVSKACGLDIRIGPYMLKAGVGFGGSCFKKDVLHLAYLADTLGLPQIADYWQSIIAVNSNQQRRFVERIMRKLPNPLSDQRIAILGFAFKAGTGDTRDSPAIAIVKGLLGAGYHLAIYDPEVPEPQIWKALQEDSDSEFDMENIVVYSNPYDACDGVHSVAILTDWDEFGDEKNAAPSSKSSDPVVLHSLNLEDLIDRENGAVNGNSKHLVSAPRVRLHWNRVAGMMRHPRYVFDGRNILSDRVLDLGLNLEGIGRGSSSFNGYTPMEPLLVGDNTRI